MKRTLSFAFAAFAFFEFAYFAQAVNQPHNLGYVSLSLSSGTLTEIIRSTAPTVGYPRFCTNCAASGNAGTICVSTGAATWGQFVLSTGTRCQ
jgi:hypothetical protein